MPTHAEIAAQLLTDASGFFRTLAEQNQDIQKDMNDNADVFEQMAALIANDPQGEVNGQPYAVLAGQLLQDAAKFFRTLASENPPLEEQMNENANVFDHISALVSQNPLGVLD